MLDLCAERAETTAVVVRIKPLAGIPKAHSVSHAAIGRGEAEAHGVKHEAVEAGKKHIGLRESLPPRGPSSVQYGDGGATLRLGRERKFKRFEIRQIRSLVETTLLDAFIEVRTKIC